MQYTHLCASSVPSDTRTWSSAKLARYRHRGAAPDAGVTEQHTSPLALLRHTTASRGSSPGPIEPGPCLVEPFFPLDEVQTEQRGKSRRR